MTRALNRGNADLIDECVSALELQEIDSLLDVGFGGGRALRVAAGLAPKARLYGVDFSPDVVAHGQQTLRPLVQSGRLSLLAADVLQLPFADSLFTKIITTNTIYFWPDLPTALASLARVLAPEGRLVIGFSGKDKLDAYGDVTEHGFTKRSDGEVVGALREAGFSDVTIRALKHGRAQGDFIAIAQRASP
jgi:SAM-dependent methyltransferase